MSKNDEFLTISEFAELVGMPVSTLRKYEKLGLFHPLRRGDPLKNQYRYYSPMQFLDVKIVHLLYEIGVPPKKIKDLLKDRTPRQVLYLLRTHLDLLDDAVSFINKTRVAVSTMIRMQQEGIMVPDEKIFTSNMPEECILLGHINDFSEESNFWKEFLRFCRIQKEPM